VSRAVHRHLRWLAAGVLLGPAASLWLFAAPPAHAVENVETGVWWRNETGAAAVPAPSRVPAGGLWVSSDPSGPSAISAIRFALSDFEGYPTVTLHIANLVAAPATPATAGSLPLLACVVTTPWTAPPTSPGVWSDRPTYDCTKGSTAGQLSPDHSTLAFNLTNLPAERSYDLALVPGTDNTITGALPPAPVATPPPPQPPAPLPTVPDPNQAASSPTFDATFQPLTQSDISAVPAASSLGPESPAQPVPTAMTPTADYGVAPAPLTGAAYPSTPSPPTPVPSLAAPPAALRTGTPAAPLANFARTSTTARIIAAAVFGALAMWAWQILSAGDPTAVAVSRGRKSLTLNDPVALPERTGPRKRFTRGPRIGTPPALR
jgi:hypothetical protein